MELLKILTFRIGSKNFALASKNVKEIVDSPRNLKTVFYGGGVLKGLMNFDGDIISVLDLSSVLDIEDIVGQMVLLCRDRGMEKSVGLTITEVRGIKTVMPSGVDAPRDNDPPYVSGFIKEDDNQTGVMLLDLKKLLDAADSKIRE